MQDKWFVAFGDDRLKESSRRISRQAEKIGFPVDHIRVLSEKDLDAEWTKLLEEMRNSNDKGEALAGQIITDILDLDIFDDIIDPDEGIAPNGFIAFFQKIISWFQKIIEWFKNLFK